jgi:LuxR family transcriptional activator of bioluminescence operon
MQCSNELKLRLQTVSTEQQVKEFIFNLIEALEVDHFLLGIFSPLSINKTNALTIDNYPEGWRKTYDEHQLMHTDPIINYCAQNHSPIFWDQIKNEKTKIIKKVIFSGPQSGFTVPLHGPMCSFGMFSLSVSSEGQESQAVLSKALTVIQLIIPSLQDAIIRIKKDLHKKENITLTTREIECLTWATEGKSAWEISKILGCSERTITFHLKNATLKLGCANRYQAIGKAIITGVICPKL